MTPEAMQTWVQRLEPLSRECARVFCDVAPQIMARLDDRGFERWAGQGLTLAQAGWRAWECAVWYFKLSPQFLARLDLDDLGGLIEATLRVVSAAPHLAIDLLRGATRFVERDRHITLAEWATAGERLMARGHEGRLAAAYFETSPDILSLTGLSEFQEWVGLVQALGDAAEATALEVVRQSPQRLENVPPLSRLKTLRLAHVLARRMPIVAAEALSTLSGTLRAIRPPLHDRLLDLAQRVAETAPQHVDRLLNSVARLLQGLPEADQALLLGQCQRVAVVDAEAGALLGEHLPDALRQLAIVEIEAWVGHGLAALRTNRDAGLAFFSLESQACQRQLATLGRTVYLQDVQGMLRLYASALAGRALNVRPQTELPAAFQGRSRQLSTTDGETIFLASRADRFRTREENFRAYLVEAAHQAGYLEFGTFTFSLAALSRENLPSLMGEGSGGGETIAPIPPGPPFLKGGRGDFSSSGEKGSLPTRVNRGEGQPSVPSPHRGEGQGKGREPDALPFRSDFEQFFAGFPRPTVARDIFYYLEDGRIDYLLQHTYRGLAPDIARVISEELASRPPLAGQPLWEALLEVLLHLCGTGSLPARLPRVIVPLTRFLQTLIIPLRQPWATVYDSAAATVGVYQLLDQLPNVRLAGLGDVSADGAEVALADAWSMEAALQAFREMVPGVSPAEQIAYQSPERLPHQGDLKPDLVQRKLKVKDLSDRLAQLAKAAMPISAELLKALLEQGVELDIQGTSSQERDETSGLFVSDLEGKSLLPAAKSLPEQVSAQHERLRDKLEEELKTLGGGEVVYRYDEWDYLMRDYRVRWCLLRERPVEEGGEGFVASVLQEHHKLINQVRKQFQLLKPELFKKLKRRDHGEEIDIDAAVEGIVDRRVAGIAPELVYIKRDKREREVSTVFLLDLSASTDDPIEPQPFVAPTAGRLLPRDLGSRASAWEKDAGFYKPLFGTEQQKPQAKRIIDVEKEALVVMAEALESIGDEYAIYGFSGYGRENVEFFLVKDFEEPYAALARRRIDALKPHRSTRMGPAIRHTVRKLQNRGARLKTLILLSDGYPQDFDYGKDRRGKENGIQDTKVALQEARRQHIHTFCITVDREGKAYLPEMCGEEHFLVIQQVARLPQQLPKIYRGLTT